MKQLRQMNLSFDQVTEVRGRGLLCAIQFDREISGDLVQLCLGNGLLINAVKPNAIRLMPPLITQKEDVDKAVGILKDSLRKVSGR